MILTEVPSSNIAAIGFENGKLEVHFRNGTQYSYEGVSAELYLSFMRTDSKGKFFHKHIKSKFVGKRINQEKEE